MQYENSKDLTDMSHPLPKRTQSVPTPRKTQEAPAPAAAPADAQTKSAQPEEKTDAAQVEKPEKEKLPPPEKEIPANKAQKIARDKTIKIIAASFVGVVLFGFIYNSFSKSNKNKEETQAGGRAANTPRSFLNDELERIRRADEAALNGQTSDPAASTGEFTSYMPEAVWETEDTAASLPGAVPPPPAGARGVLVDNNPTQQQPAPQTQSVPPPPAQQQTQTRSGGGGSAPSTTYYRSSLVPPMEGSLFGNTRSAGAAPAAGSYAELYPYLQQPQSGTQNSAYLDALSALQQYSQGAAPTTAQTSRAGGSAQTAPFYNNTVQTASASSPVGGAPPVGGVFLGDNSLWIGTIIPAVLETGINTDLPGNVIGRITDNIYDSRYGRSLLLPQGTLLFARYNSSVSYAQARIQIVWDSLVRPDGFYLELDAQNGVDRQGFSGEEAVYHENWFEYLKAAGLITMFSIANAKMTEEAARYAASQEGAASIAAANQDFISQIGGNIVSRAMAVSPTLTAAQGSPVNIMLNKSIYLPPVESFPAEQKYIRGN